ncbi:hypothetical protein D3C72_1723180 [compost metagenome]
MQVDVHHRAIEFPRVRAGEVRCFIQPADYPDDRGAGVSHRFGQRFGNDVFVFDDQQAARGKGKGVNHLDRLPPMPHWPERMGAAGLRCGNVGRPAESPWWYVLAA